MAEDTENSMDARSSFLVRGALTIVVLLGAGLVGVAHWSVSPSFRQRNVAESPRISASAGPVAADIATGSDASTKTISDLTVVEQKTASVPSQDMATNAASPTPSTPDETPPPSNPIPATVPLAARLVPLPVPRPPELRVSKASARAPRDAASRELRAGAAPPEDTRSFIEKLFDIGSPEPPRLAYAALETKPVDTVFRRALNVVPSGGTGGVAIYDIRAKLVTLPNGERLEAHSGLGESMDDPSHVHVRMKGPTPVGTYDISEREQPFHGVRALRLNPIGGAEAVHGRVGLLAHTFMLGASGASNGCVSFRDYDKFLQAYLRGHIQRLVVVAGG